MGSHTQPSPRSTNQHSLDSPLQPCPHTHHHITSRESQSETSYLLSSTPDMSCCSSEVDAPKHRPPNTPTLTDTHTSRDPGMYRRPIKQSLNIQMSSLTPTPSGIQIHSPSLSEGGEIAPYQGSRVWDPLTLKSSQKHTDLLPLSSLPQNPRTPPGPQTHTIQGPEPGRLSTRKG